MSLGEKQGRMRLQNDVSLDIWYDEHYDNSPDKRRARRRCARIRAIDIEIADRARKEKAQWDMN
jgi:hypothetical protein